ncbi:hypothetical protein ABPG74_017565 [Tetrahymena malaccensis]
MGLIQSQSQQIEYILKQNKYQFDGNHKELQKIYAYSEKHQRNVQIQIQSFRQEKNINELKKCIQAHKRIENERFIYKILEVIQSQSYGIYAVVTEQSDGDLEIISSLFQLTYPQVLILTYQLINGLNTLVQNGLFLKNITSKNIIYSIEKNEFMLELQPGNTVYELNNLNMKESMFSLGLIILEVYMNRQLKKYEINLIKTKNLISAIPQLIYKNQREIFFQEILTNILNVNEGNLSNILYKLENLKGFLNGDEQLDFYKQKVEFQQYSKIEQTLNKFRKLEDIEIKLHDKQEEKTEINSNLGKLIATFNQIKTLNVKIQYDSHINQLCLDSLIDELRGCIHLTTLSLQLDYIKISQTGIVQLAKKLQNYQSLGYFKMSLNQKNIQGDKFLEFFKYSLNIKKLQTIILYLDQNNIGQFNEIQQNFEEFKNDNITNMQLFLRQNQINTDGAIKICHLIQSICQNIQHFTIDLIDNDISNQGVEQFGNEIAKLSKLEYLNLFLKENLINSDGVQALYSGLAQNQNITSLDISLKTSFFTCQKQIQGLKNLKLNINVSQHSTLPLCGLELIQQNSKNLISIDLEIKEQTLWDDNLISRSFLIILVKNEQRVECKEMKKKEMQKNKIQSILNKSSLILFKLCINLVKIMKQITIRSNESSLYQPQYSTKNCGNQTYNFYDDKNTNYTISNTVDLEARSLMSSRMSQRYSRSQFQKGSQSCFKTNSNDPKEEQNLSRKQSNKSLNENFVKNKVQIYDQLKSNTHIYSDSFQIERLNYTELFAKRVNYQGIILFEPNPYLLPVFRKDKKKHQTKVSDVSLLLFNQYMKKSNQQKEKMAKQLQKQLAKEVDSQNSELNYMKKSEFKNNNFFNKNLKRKLVKNIAKQNVEQFTLSPSCKQVKKARSLSEDQNQFKFSQTQNTFFCKEQGNNNKSYNTTSEIQQKNNNQQSYQTVGYDPYGTVQQTIPNQSRRHSQVKSNRQLSYDEKLIEKETEVSDNNTGSKRQILQNIYKDRIQNLSKILNEQKQNQLVRPQTAQVSRRIYLQQQNYNSIQQKTIHDQSFY